MTSETIKMLEETARRVDLIGKMHHSAMDIVRMLRLEQNRKTLRSGDNEVRTRAIEDMLEHVDRSADYIAKLEEQLKPTE
jgi:hypothetical protein